MSISLCLGWHVADDPAKAAVTQVRDPPGNRLSILQLAATAIQVSVNNLQGAHVERWILPSLPPRIGKKVTGFFGL
jgi:hypothetical protein